MFANIVKYPEYDMSHIVIYTMNVIQFINLTYLSPLVRLLHLLEHTDMPLECNHAFVVAHDLFDVVWSLPSCKKGFYHWANLESPMVARFSPWESHRIICHMQKSQNGKIRSRVMTDRRPGISFWHIQKPVQFSPLRELPLRFCVIGESRSQQRQHNPENP